MSQAEVEWAAKGPGLKETFSVPIDEIEGDVPHT
jgi:hypothetical protein